jgi:hypothetical protein
MGLIRQLRCIFQQCFQIFGQKSFWDEMLHFFLKNKKVEKSKFQKWWQNMCNIWCEFMVSETVQELR